MPKGQILRVQYIKTINDKQIILAYITESLTKESFTLYMKDDKNEWKKVSVKRDPDFDDEVM